MVLAIFRLNKKTGTTATFTLGKDIDFDKLIFKGYSIDFPNHLANDADGQAPTTGNKAIYLQTNFLTDNDVLFYQGKNATITPAGNFVDHFIPLGSIKDVGINYVKMDLTVIDFPTKFNSSDTLIFTLNQIEENIVAQLTSAQLFGIDADAQPQDIDHGINLYFEFKTDQAHNKNQSVTIADAT